MRWVELCLDWFISATTCMRTKAMLRLMIDEWWLLLDDWWMVVILMMMFDVDWSGLLELLNRLIYKYRHVVVSLFNWWGSIIEDSWLVMDDLWLMIDDWCLMICVLYIIGWRSAAINSTWTLSKLLYDDPTLLSWRDLKHWEASHAGGYTGELLKWFDLDNTWQFQDIFTKRNSLASQMQKLGLASQEGTQY